MRLPVGTITLLIVAVLVYFGVAQRLLDRMRLNDRTAILFIGAMLIGAYLPDIPLGNRLTINIGGGLIPIAFALYLWFTADTSRERWRAFWATLVSTALVYAATIFLPEEPQTIIIDPIYAFAIIAGLTAYLFGRSRRASLIAGILSIALNDIIYAIQVVYHGQAGSTSIGGAGIFDTMIVSALLAAALAEIIGETREKMAGGHQEPAGEPRRLRLVEQRSQPESSPKEGEDR
ncbi:MAG: DUF1614 domain-containing protein [Firmicutes bacterium]|nr:DUF1614 domain-containing protein [Bacillota bacterium]